MKNNNETHSVLTVCKCSVCFGLNTHSIHSVLDYHHKNGDDDDDDGFRIRSH